MSRRVITVEAKVSWAVKYHTGTRLAYMGVSMPQRADRNREEGNAQDRLKSESKISNQTWTRGKPVQMGRSAILGEHVYCPHAQIEIASSACTRPEPAVRDLGAITTRPSAHRDIRSIYITTSPDLDGASAVAKDNRKATATVMGSYKISIIKWRFRPYAVIPTRK
ncbi:hypothetical protein FIBSPDRAFT_902976 [Athelia psychrophila]|uniref:Uncharacterized protein n=1 Tax=Athelia psychrophila TaxID=1759441 RepID=A0A167WK17_9AGAM|nr:hypothetical protein FIBSPDRAFT_902976 [Fibularhizoctonia sp. CBS 109695]